MPVPKPKTEKGRIDLHEIKKLIAMIEVSPITEFELVDRDLKIRISKNGTAYAVAPPAPVAVNAAPSASALAAPAALPAAPAMPTAAPAAERKYYEVKSPMVGTCYRAPAPDAEVYVKVGDHVEPGKVLCIVEAMKLMNELECEVKGRIVEILIENAQPVEFGQTLFRIDTSE